MAFWNKKESKDDTFVYVEIKAPLEYARILVELADSHEYRNNTRCFDEETATVGFELPQAKLDKVLACCSKGLASKFM